MDENFNLSFPPNAFTEHWAREKAKKIAKEYPEHIVLGADTVVVLNNKILGKPKDTNQSFKMLTSLSAKTHEVITGISIIHIKGKVDLTFNQKTYVTIKAINSDDIIRYIDTYDPYDKAGSYGIQDGFSAYISKINGCYFNVMGLPLATFKEYYDNKKIIIADEKINFKAVRSSGPGGQHANKVSTAIHLKYNINEGTYPDWFVKQLKKHAGSLISKNHILIIKASSFRSQFRNKQDALDRMLKLFKRASTKPEKRIRTNTPKKTNENRLKIKKRLSQKKFLRKSPSLDD